MSSNHSCSARSGGRRTTEPQGTGGIRAAARGDKRATRVRIGVIGYGYWGPNIVRNLTASRIATWSQSATGARRALQRAQQDLPPRPADDRFLRRFCSRPTSTRLR